MKKVSSNGFVFGLSIWERYKKFYVQYHYSVGRRQRKMTGYNDD